MMKTTAQEVAAFLGLDEAVKRDFPVWCAGVPTNVSAGMLTLVTRKGESLPNLFGTAAAEVLVIAPAALRQQAESLPQTFLFSENPRLMFCRVLNRFFTEPFVPQIAESAKVRTFKPLNPHVRIGEGCVISGEVTIGDRTVIEPNVVITGKVILGSDVHIKAGAVIGQKGFGFERDDSGTPVLFPQLGGVRIGDRVEIGALTTVARGTLGDTVVSDDVKMDDHVHIAHNVEIGPRCLVSACVMISGGTKIGSDAWIGPNATISNALKIGEGASVSLGAVVAQSVKPGARVTGNFAEPHDQFLRRMLDDLRRYGQT